MNADATDQHKSEPLLTIRENPVAQVFIRGLSLFPLLSYCRPIILT
jgi:hypothetical protein